MERPPVHWIHRRRGPSGRRASGGCARALRLLLGFVLASGVALAGCDGSGTEPPATEQGWNLPADQVLEGVTHTISVDGVREALLNADTAYLYEDSSGVDLRGVDLHVYDDEGHEQAHVVSKTGTLDTRTNAMIARGDVVVTTQEKDRRIETQELHYDPQGNRIWSDQPTVLVENGVRTTGTSFTSDAEFKNVTIEGAKARGIRIRM